MNKARYSFFASFFMMLIIAVSAVSCDSLQKSEFEKNMVATQDAMEAMDWPLAERLLQSMLYENTKQLERWDIWMQLLEVRHNQEPYSALMVEYLESMFAEFEEFPEYTSIILQRLAIIYTAMRQYENAHAALEWHQALPDLSDEERASIYRKMAQVNIALELYEMATDNLQICLSFQHLSIMSKAQCKYDLANVSYVQGKHMPALVLAREVFALEGISDALRGRAGFMVADCLSAQNKIQEALAVFKSIQPYYPNELVIYKHIEYLQSGKRGQSTLKALARMPKK